MESRLRLLVEGFSDSGSLPGFSTKGGRILVRPLVFREASKFLIPFIRADECLFALRMSFCIITQSAVVIKYTDCISAEG